MANVEYIIMNNNWKSKNRPVRTMKSYTTYHIWKLHAAINILNEGLRMRTVGTTEIA